MKKLLAEYKMGNGISFFIPCMPEEQTPEQQVNEAIEDIHALADSINEEFENGADEAERFYDYMRNGEESLLREQENHFPL